MCDYVEQQIYSLTPFIPLGIKIFQFSILLNILHDVNHDFSSFKVTFKITVLRNAIGNLYLWTTCYFV